MDGLNCDVYENEFEEALLDVARHSFEDEKDKVSPIQRRAAFSKLGLLKGIVRERSQSLYSFGNNLKQRQNLLSTPISEQPESLESLKPEKQHSTATLPRLSKPSKRLKRLNTLLLEALRYRGVEEIEKLIIAGANPNATCCIECVSACHLAAMRSDGALAVLLSHGADRLRCDKIGRTPLHLAAWAGNVRQMAMLLGFSKDLTNRLSTTMSGSVEDEIKHLSQYTREMVNVKCSFTKLQATLPNDWGDNMTEHNCEDFEKTIPLLQPGWTPLHAASFRAKSDCTRLLIAAGADPCIRDVIGRTPLDIAGSMYYSDDKIDPKSFADTVSVLADEECNFSIKNRKTLDTPLHTAVELNSMDAVKALLNVNVPVSWLNRAGLTPMHICVKKKLGEILQTLLNDSLEFKNDKKYQSATVNVRDKNGYTVLHAAVLECWEQGVCIALESGANVIIKDNEGETALHLASAAGNIGILNKILFAERPKNSINAPNLHGETPLAKAVINGHTECVKRLLKERASISKTLPEQINVFHLAAERGNVEVLQVLLDDDYSLTREVINFLTEDKDGFGPIHYAVQNNHPQCVKLLLSRNTFRSLKTSATGIYAGSTPLHIAAIYNNVEIAKIIMKNNPDTVHNVNNLEWTPLHTASHYGSRDMITLLLTEGADLAGVAVGPDKKTKTTALDLIMDNLSRPTEFLSYIFDTYIFTNDCYIQEPNCEVTVDYQILVPKTKGDQQMKVIEALLRTGDRYSQTRLLVHPLLESFLHLKWKALLPFFYTMILMYGVYVMVLTTYITSEFFYKDTGSVRPKWIEPSVLAVILYIVSFLVIALLETWIKFGAIGLALTLPSTLTIADREKEDYPRHIATVSLLMAWLEMMFLLSRFPNWGYYVLMFGKVSCNVLKILLTFSFLVIGFSLSFMVQFHHEKPFEGPWAALVKILVMMTSEFDYSNLIEATVTKNGTNAANAATITEKFLPSLLLVRLIFVIFLILAAIVLMNLMVGVAVNDLHNLQVLGNIRRLTKQVEFLVSLDRLLYNRYIRKLLPKRLKMFLINKKTILHTVVLRPNDPNSECYKDLPSEIRDSIFEKAQLRKKQMEDELGSRTYKKKLDEIYEATVLKKTNKQGGLDIVSKCKYISQQITSEIREKRKLEAISKKIVELDSGIVDVKKQMAESLNEIKSAVGELEMKMDMILNKLQGTPGNPGKSDLKLFNSDKN